MPVQLPRAYRALEYSAHDSGPSQDQGRGYSRAHGRGRGQSRGQRQQKQGNFTITAWVYRI